MVPLIKRRMTKAMMMMMMSLTGKLNSSCHYFLRFQLLFLYIYLHNNMSMFYSVVICDYTMVQV